MPLPWKKTRISQFVTDHLNSPKRGGSLVVETGFPTSLIDLFVKNKDRLKKSSKKKHPKTKIKTKTNHDLDPPLPQILPLPEDLADEIGEKNEILMGGGEKVVETQDGNRVLLAVLKVFLVVVLALGTKRFVVGITLSAFLLFFLEHVGKYVYRLFGPFFISNKVLRLVSLVQRFLLFVLNKHKDLEREFDDSKGPIAENLILQPKFNWVPPVEQIRCVEGSRDIVGCNERLSFEEMDSKKGIMVREEDNICEGLELKRAHSRRHKMKSKMKKLLPKKFRSSKKKSLDSKIEVDGSIVEEGEEQCVLECHDKSSSMLSSGGSYYDGEEVICNSGELSRVISKENFIEEELGGGVPQGNSNSNSGYWVLCLIVLAGLVGGRIWALGLTLCWCLMLKSGRTVWRFVKVPMCRTSVGISN